MESVAARMGSIIKSMLIKPRVNDALSPKPDTLTGCLTILSQRVPIASRVDKGMIFNKEPGSTTTRLSPTSHIIVCYGTTWLSFS